MSIEEAHKAALDQFGRITQIREALIASAGSLSLIQRSTRVDPKRAPRSELEKSG
jgi:hypothetical protein